MLDEDKQNDEKADDITALETHSEKSLFYRTIPEYIKAYVVLMEGTEEKRRFDIVESPVFIGRDRGMDIQIEDSSVSREHAVLFFYDNRFYVRDLKSTNGTLVNGKRIEQTALNYKDLIQLGKCVLRFFVEQAEKK
jgi:pSer/pThr/pTyr-binding forkhead associated (FHA) protein